MLDCFFSLQAPMVLMFETSFLNTLFGENVDIENTVFHNDGKYSIDETPLYLSSLWNVIFSMSTFSPKSVYKKLVSNINTMGAWRLKKQSSIQFHIWK